MCFSILTLFLLTSLTGFKFYTLQFEITFLFLVLEEISSLNPTKLIETDEYRLVHDLVYGYNHSDVRPVRNSSNAVNVEFQMKLSRLVKVVGF